MFEPDEPLRYWTGRYKGYGHFDSLRCAAKFGQMAHAFGYVIGKV